MFDFSEARRTAKRVQRRRVWGNLRGLVVPITAHVGSVATIFGVYFLRTGSLSFDPTSPIDWLVSVVLLGIASSGLLLTIREIRHNLPTVVSRNELTQLMAIARLDADATAETLAGDLSWLEEEIPALLAIKEARPRVRIVIFYDRDRVRQESLPELQKLRDRGVELIPYPPGVTTTVRCTIVDRSSARGARSYVYPRGEVPAISLPRSQHLFKWFEVGAQDAVSKASVSSYLELLHRCSSHGVWVGISGMNNVGKTTLAKRIRSRLEDRYRVDLIPDQFRSAGNGVSIEDNVRVLFSQLVAQQKAEADVCIFDRTLIDNLCFLRLRANPDETLYEELAPVVAVAARRLDLTVDVQLAEGSQLLKSSHVSGAQRRFVRGALDEFFRTYDVNRITVELDPSDEDSIDRAADTVIEAIGLIARERSFRPR